MTGPKVAPHAPDAPLWAKRLRELRQQSGVSVSKLASDLHVSASSMRHYDAGTRVPSSVLAVRLAAYFGVSVESIFGEEKS
jgi:DNA-binding XRE family transcriptional regulator